MNPNPCLTISLLSQFTNQELQSNYLNHLDRTAEIASLLAQITDAPANRLTQRDLVLRVINLALEVDLCLGAHLTASIDPELQQIVVDDIERLEIPTRLKISLWRKTKSKAALPYLQDIFIFNDRFPNTYEGHREIESATSTITYIDRDLAVALLIEELHHPDRYHRSAEIMVDLAPVEAIEPLGDLLQTGDRRNCRAQYHSIEALAKIGTEAAISKLREVLQTCKHQWSDTDWIHGLGIIAEPAMVEHLIDLLYDPELYTERSGNTYEADRPCSEAIAALEHIGGEKVFDWLHQAIYWISADDEFESLFHTIVQTLFRLDSDRTLTALEGAIHSYDPVVRKRAAMALVVWEVPLVDRNLSILLSAIDDPDFDVQIKIVCGIREIIHLSMYGYHRLNITPELIDRAILETKPIVLKYINHPDLEIRERVIGQLSEREAYEWQLVECKTEPPNLSTLFRELHDPEIDIQKSAVTSIVELGSVEIFPILLEIAKNPELVGTLIWRLLEHHRSGTGIIIFEEFPRHREIAIEFLETAEKSLIAAIYNNIDNNIGSPSSNMVILSEIGSDLAIAPLQQIIRSDAYAYYDEPEDAVRSLATIGTEAAKMALLETLTVGKASPVENRPNLGRSVFNIFSTDGKLGLVPQLWSAHRQTYVDGGLAAISEIQERAGLYNPDFSDRSHSLFEPPSPRLRDILLGNTATAIEI
jgi:HEAT repeat protein